MTFPRFKIGSGPLHSPYLDKDLPHNICAGCLIKHVGHVAFGFRNPDNQTTANTTQNQATMPNPAKRC